MAKNPYWIYANDYQIPASEFLFTHESFEMNGIKRTSYSDMSPRPETKKGVIKTVARRPVSNAQKYKWDEIATTMEWYDPQAVAGAWENT